MYTLRFRLLPFQTEPAETQLHSGTRMGPKALSDDLIMVPAVSELVEGKAPQSKPTG